MKILAMEQGSGDWCEIRRGIPTASEFSNIITPARGQLSKSAGPYAAELVAETTKLGWQEWLDNDYSGSPDLMRGRNLEAAARAWFAFEKGADIKEVGFCLSDCGRFGASPDGILPNGEPLELKAPRVKTHSKWLLDGDLPDAHKVQVHGEIFVTGADRGWFMSYVEEPAVKPLLVEVKRSDFTEKLGDAVMEFVEKILPETREKILNEPLAES